MAVPNAGLTSLLQVAILNYGCVNNRAKHLYYSKIHLKMLYKLYIHACTQATPTDYIDSKYHIRAVGLVWLLRLHFR